MHFLRIGVLTLVLLVAIAAGPALGPPGASSVPTWLGSAAADDCITVDPLTGNVTVEPENCPPN
jgi:hypothetical protein